MEKIDLSTLRNISYGLYVLTSRTPQQDNGCIINTVVQITEKPLRMVISVNKNNLTNDFISESGIFTLSLLTEETPMDLIKHFGFQSGRTVNKFSDLTNTERAENGLLYLTQYTNGVISGKVLNKTDMDTHTLYVAEITESLTLSDKPSLTYDYYQKNIKPQPTPQPQENGKTRWVCQVCGYVYEGEELPEDFVCPWCQPGPSDFVKEEN
ncbi:MAG: flavin reductase [Bacteroidales bacterium]|nr:flavin reductase [Bacteroidales bacterium]